MGAMRRITRTEYTSADPRALLAKCEDGAEVRRMLALALVLDGRPRAEAAAVNGMDRQTLCDWVHRYNAGGLEGPKSRESPGKASLLSEARKAELHALVIQGPDPAVNKVVRWRCVDLQAEVARRWSITVDASTIGGWLGKRGLTRLQPRPVLQDGRFGGRGGGLERDGWLQRRLSHWRLVIRNMRFCVGFWEFIGNDRRRGRCQSRRFKHRLFGDVAGLFVGIGVGDACLTLGKRQRQARAEMSIDL